MNAKHGWEGGDFGTEVWNKVWNRGLEQGLEQRFGTLRFNNSSPPPSLVVVCLEVRIKAAPHPSFTMPRASGWAAVDAQLAACERAVLGSAAASGLTEEKLIKAFKDKLIAQHNYQNAKELKLGAAHLDNLLELFHAAVRYLNDVLEYGRDEGVYTPEVITECRTKAEDWFQGLSRGPP